MSLNVKELCTFGRKNKELENLVQEQLQIIDVRLRDTKQTWGRNCIAHELPIHYTVHGMKKEDIELIVYSQIIESLERRGFEIRINLRPTLTMLWIAWDNTIFSPHEILNMKKALAAKIIEQKDIHRFSKCPTKD